MKNPKKIKIAVYTSYGSTILTDGMKEAIRNKKGLERKTALAEYMEKNAKEITSSDFYVEKMDTGVLYKVETKIGTRYAVSEEAWTGNMVTGIWKIVEIDTSKLWHINEYDGSEGVSYFEAGENNQLIQVYPENGEYVRD